VWLQKLLTSIVAKTKHAAVEQDTIVKINNRFKVLAFAHSTVFRKAAKLSEGPMHSGLERQNGTAKRDLFELGECGDRSAVAS
jgi:hypothetical protein